MSARTEVGFELKGERSQLGPLLADLWRSRDLTRLLAKREFLVNYRRASFGVLWAIGLPLAQALIVGLTLSRVVRFETKGGYALFVFAGTLPWTFFNGALTVATNSIVIGSELATRVYFPRAVLPIVTVLSALRGFIPSVAVLIGLAAIFRAPLGLDLFLLIPATVLMVTLTAGFSLVLAALQVYFRDMKFIVAASTLPWFWTSGAIFPLDKLGSMRHWLELNPVVGMIEFYRASLGTASAGWGRSVWICAAWAVGLIALSLPLYRRYDRVFVDLL